MKDDRAFEYVIGTLRGDDRARFEEQLQASDSLQNDVHFWEERLVGIQDTTSTREPLQSTWEAIESRLHHGPAAEKKNRFWHGPFWRFSTALLACAWLVALGVMLTLGVSVGPGSGLNADYVAVLTDDTGAAKLTAHTSIDGKKLWLKWDNPSLASDKSLQLWAQSRRDSQIRPLHVFDTRSLDDPHQALSLDEANLRLIKDAEYLILTEEEAGGSPIDEPSDMLVAKGICVRLDIKS